MRENNLCMTAYLNRKYMNDEGFSKVNYATIKSNLSG